MASHRLVALVAALLGNVDVGNGQALRHFPPFKTIDRGANPAAGCALLEGNYVPVEGYADCDLARVAFDSSWHWRQPECGEVDCTSSRPVGCTHHPNVLSIRTSTRALVVLTLPPSLPPSLPP